MLEELRELNWESYDEVRQGFLLMMAPFSEKLKAGTGHLKLGNHGAVYDEETSEMETFCRLIWGIGPFLSENDDDSLSQQLLTGLAAACDPESEVYYGKLTDYHQKFVEMAAIAVCFLLAKAKTWDVLSQDQQKNMAAWLLQINQHRIPKNNWRFFRILINVAMKKMGMPYEKNRIDEDFAYIEACYAGEGWYFDGKETQFDYYISWGFHFYSLIYVKVMGEEDALRVAQMKSRAILFAQSYQYWFDKSGVAIPFGRSLTYRFAQAAFWGALALADVEALPWGVIKGLFARNMKAWMQEAIFTEADFLSIGYRYENLNMSEGYNAPGSAYWAFKSFIVLAIPASHPFWREKSLPTNLSVKTKAMPSVRHLIEHVGQSDHVLLYPAGQFIQNQSHAPAKYGKFVYSTHFGFSVPKGGDTYATGAYDNVLAISEDGGYFRPKGLDTNFEIKNDQIIHQWQPMTGVNIKSTIVPCGHAHVRIHEIDTKREVFLNEGGFSVALREERTILTQSLAQVDTKIGQSLIKNILGFDQAEMIRPEVNTNLFYPRTILPTLSAKLLPGRHLLISLVAGTPQGQTPEMPHIYLTQKGVDIIRGDEKSVRVTLASTDHPRRCLTGKKLTQDTQKYGRI
ncbi:hypothetical protein FACS1894192_02980 [Bacilli bacterium]|nr:hypothetical protein FACS1894192_02980 [Bacilli bacterium]GHU45194.1 hypothetical protein FACS1894194_0360 [Bacilli bacterium]